MANDPVPISPDRSRSLRPSCERRCRRGLCFFSLGATGRADRRKVSATRWKTLRSDALGLRRGDRVGVRVRGVVRVGRRTTPHRDRAEAARAEGRARDAQGALCRARAGRRPRGRGVRRLSKRRVPPVADGRGVRRRARAFVGGGGVRRRTRARARPHLRRRARRAHARRGVVLVRRVHGGRERWRVVRSSRVFDGAVVGGQSGIVAVATADRPLRPQRCASLAICSCSLRLSWSTTAPKSTRAAALTSSPDASMPTTRAYAMP